MFCHKFAKKMKIPRQISENNFEFATFPTKLLGISIISTSFYVKKNSNLALVVASSANMELQVAILVKLKMKTLG